MDIYDVGSYGIQWSNCAQTFGRTETKVKPEDKETKIAHTDSQGLTYVDNEGVYAFTARHIGAHVAALVLIPQAFAVIDTAYRVVALAAHATLALPAKGLSFFNVTALNDFTFTAAGEHLLKTIANIFFATIGTAAGFIVPGYTNQAYNAAWTAFTFPESDERKLEKAKAAAAKAKADFDTATDLATKAKATVTAAKTTLDNTTEEKDDKKNAPHLTAKTAHSKAQEDQKVAENKATEAKKVLDAANDAVKVLEKKIADSKIDPELVKAEKDVAAAKKVADDADVAVTEALNELNKAPVPDAKDKDKDKDAKQAAHDKAKAAYDEAVVAQTEAGKKLVDAQTALTAANQKAGK